MRTAKAEGWYVLMGASWHVRAAVVKVSAVCKEGRHHASPSRFSSLSFLPCPPSFPSLKLSALLLRLRLRDNIVRFHRRVSSTSLTLPPPRLSIHSHSLFPPSRHFSRAPFPLSRVTGLTLSTLLPCCSRSYSFPRASNPFDQFHFRRSAILQSSFLPYRCCLPLPPTFLPLPTHAVLPDLFEKQNVLGTLILCESERAREKENKKRKGKDTTLFLEGRNENYAGPTSASAHLLARKGCNGRQRWTRKPGGKKKKESHSAENEKVRRRVTTRWPGGWPDEIIGYTRIVNLFLQNESRFAAVYNSYPQLIIHFLFISRYLRGILLNI